MWCDVCAAEDCYHIIKQKESKDKPWDALDNWVIRDCPDCCNKGDCRLKCVVCKGFGYVRFQVRDVTHWQPKLQTELPKTEKIDPPKKPEPPTERKLELE